LTALAQEAGTAKTEQATTEPAKTEKAPKWKRPAFAIKLGSFMPTVNTVIRTDATGAAEGTPIDLEEDLGLDKNLTMLRLDGDIRIAPWFSLGLGYYGFKRSQDKAISEEIQIGDTVYPINQTLKTSLNTSYMNADLKFYLFHRQRWDLGVYAGVNLAHYKLNVRAQELDRQLLEIQKIWAPVPSVGLHFAYTIVPNLYLYGKAGYFTFSNKRLDFDSATFNLNLDYYFYKFVGIGARYEYSRFDANLDILNWNGRVKYDLAGFNAYLTLGF
jgi:hypothetical protein